MNEIKELQKALSDEELKRAITTPRLVRMITQMSVAEQEELIQYLTEKELCKKRKHPRKDCQLQVEYLARDRVFRDFIQSISANGMFIETKESFHLGETITLIFTFPNREKPMKLNGEVVRIARDGIGVQFKQLTPYLEDIIRQLVDTM